MTTELVEGAEADVQTMKAIGSLKPAMPTLAAAAARSLALQLDVAKACAITDAETYVAVVKQGQAANKLAKDLNDERLEITRPLDELKGRWIETFAEPIALANAIVAELRPKATAWTQKLAEERRKAEEAARLQREQAERERLEAIRVAQVEADRVARVERERLAEEARVAREENERKIREAATSGNVQDAIAAARDADRIERDTESSIREVDEKAHAAVERAYQMPVIAQAVPAATTHQPAVKGAAIKGTWKHEVESLEAVVRGIVADLDRGDRSSLVLVTPSAEIGKRARALGEHCRIPGVRVWRDQSTSFARK